MDREHPLVLFIAGIIAYITVSAFSYTTAAALYAAVAAGIVVSALTRSLAKAVGLAVTASLIGSLAYLIYYWSAAPREVMTVFEKLGGAALMPLIYSIMASLLAALSVWLLRRR